MLSLHYTHTNKMLVKCLSCKNNEESHTFASKAKLHNKHRKLCRHTQMVNTCWKSIFVILLSRFVFDICMPLYQSITSMLPKSLPLPPTTTAPEIEGWYTARFLPYRAWLRYSIYHFHFIAMAITPLAGPKDVFINSHSLHDGGDYYFYIFSHSIRLGYLAPMRLAFIAFQFRLCH